MAFPLPRGITPHEIAFLCEMEMVTVLPRQRLEGLELLGGKTEPLQPPRRGVLPLWLALLLKRQRRVNILPPLWLHPEALSKILQLETDNDTFSDTFSPSQPLTSSDSKGNRGASLTQFTLDGQKHVLSPPFLPQSTADNSGASDTAQTPLLPYHWLELATMLLDSASDDLVEPDSIRRVLRDLREVRMAKMRKQVDHLDAIAVGGGSGVALVGIGAMEVGEGRGFMSGAAEVLRQINASKEESMRGQEAEGDEDARDEGTYDDDYEMLQ